MKIIQQDFRIVSKGGFLFITLSLIFFSYAFIDSFSEDYHKNNLSLGLMIFYITGASFLGTVHIWGIYQTACIYEFKQKEITVSPFFGLFGKKSYMLKDLTQVEYSINPRDMFDRINLYFGNGKKKKRISINMFPSSLEEIKLFLYAHVENLEDIADIEYRSTMW